LQKFEIFVADADYDRIVQTLSRHHPRWFDTGNVSHKAAVEALANWLQNISRESDVADYVENVRTPPTIVTPVEWVQPQGADVPGAEPYRVGDVVLYNGQPWQSTVADNVWVPGEYGWELA